MQTELLAEEYLPETQETQALLSLYLPATQLVQTVESKEEIEPDTQLTQIVLPEREE
jgi:hypothetical protein